MSKRSEFKWCGIPQAESRQEENLTKYAGFIYAYVRKQRK